MIDVNLRGVLHGIAAALPVMQQQGHGYFINVSSTAGHTVYPTAAVYSATKCAVIAISEALRQEHDTMRVTIISPGATESELADSISDAGARDAMKEFRRVAMPPEAIRPRHIVTGQYLGFTALLAISLLGFLGGLVVPRAWIGLLGLAPNRIGVKKFL